MAISLSSVFGFNLAFQARYHHGINCCLEGASLPKAIHFTYPNGMFRLRKFIIEKHWSICFPIFNKDQFAADISDKVSGNAGSSPSEDQFSAIKPTSLDSEAGNSKPETQVNDEAGPRTTEVPNGSTVSSIPQQETSPSRNTQSTPKRSSLTARERLKAARVLNRYAETKAPKSEMGSKVLAALRESDRGKKRSGLPEAPKYV